MKLTNKEFYRNLNYLYGELKSKKIELSKRKREDAPIGELVNLSNDIATLDSLIEQTLEADVVDNL